MATDNTTPAASQADTPVSTPVQATTNTPDPQAGEGQETISLEEARKLRKEAQALRTRLNGYEAAEKAAQEAALSEVDKATKRAADAEVRIQQYQKQLVNAQVRLAAKDRNIIDPDMAALALDGKLEYGDDGMPTNLDKALDDLVKSKPYLVAKAEAAPPTPAQTNTPQLPAMNPGRSSIQSPGSLPPGRIPTLDEVYRMKR